MKFIRKYWTGLVILISVASFINTAVGIFLAGSLIFYLAITGVAFILVIRKKGIECNGKYLSFQPGRNGNKNPNIEFTTLAGELIKGQPTAYASTDLGKFRSYKSLIGNEVSILYDPEKPDKFIIADETAFTFFVFIAILLISLAFILHSLYVFGHYLKVF